MMSERYSDILLFSGGLDSFIAYYYLNKPQTLYVDLHHKYAIKEKEAVVELSKLLKMNTIIDSSTLDLSKHEEADADIPMRNMFLAMNAAYYGDNVYVISQRGETSIPDRSPKFFSMASKDISFLMKKPIMVSTPFLKMTKTIMVKWYIENDYSVENLLKTVSCFSSTNGKQCGKCGSCFRRFISLEYNGIHEDYENNMLEWDQIPIYIKKMKNGEYDKQRTLETKQVLTKYIVW